MKNILILFITFLSISAVAQEKKITVKQDQAQALANSETKKLVKELNLNSDQEKKVNTVMLAYYKEKLQSKQKLKQMVKSKSGNDKIETKKAIKEYKQTSSDKLNNELKEILTEKQFSTYLEKQKTNKKAMLRKN